MPHGSLLCLSHLPLVLAKGAFTPPVPTEPGQRWESALCQLGSWGRLLSPSGDVGNRRSLAGFEGRRETCASGNQTIVFSRELSMQDLEAAKRGQIWEPPGGFSEQSCTITPAVLEAPWGKSDLRWMQRLPSFLP